MQACYLHRPVKIVRHVFFTRPDQLHGQAAANHRYAHRLRHVVDLQPPPKAAAQQRSRDRDIVNGHARHTRCDLSRHLRYLRRNPDMHLTANHLRGTVHWLQCGVGQIRGAVSGFYQTLRRLHSLRHIDIACFIKRMSRGLRQASQQAFFNHPRV